MYMLINVTLIQKKEHVVSKTYKRLTFNSIFNYFTKNNLFTKSESGFLPSDLRISQLLTITSEILKQADCNLPLDVRGIFLDISKAFDKVWYEEYLFMLKIYGVNGKLLNLIQD